MIGWHHSHCAWLHQDLSATKERAAEAPKRKYAYLKGQENEKYKDFSNCGSGFGLDGVLGGSRPGSADGDGVHISGSID